MLTSFRSAVSSVAPESLYLEELISTFNQYERYMMADNKLDITESSDFHYLLELLPLLYDTDEYQWLPELFSIIGHEKLLLLAKYAGGETFKVPTVEELTISLEALDWYYKVYITRKKRPKSIPSEYVELVKKIKGTIDARYN